MYVLIITAVFPPEPVVSAQLSYDISTSLSTRIDTTVISPKPTRPYGFKFDTKPEITTFKHIQINSYTCPGSSFFGRVIESISFGVQCYKFILRNHNQIKAIYCNTWPFFAQYFTVKASKKFRIPIILHIQDIYPESFTNKLSVSSSLINSILVHIDKYICLNSTKIIALSEKSKRYMIKTRCIKDENIYVIPNWQDEKLFTDDEANSEASNTGDQLFTFMYLGNIGPVAGVDFLIEVFSNAHLDNCRLIIAGSGSLKENLVKKVNETNGKMIEFWHVLSGQVAEVQCYADVMLLPIRKNASSSSIPSKLPAYMFSAKPIIASVDADSDTAMAIRDSQCGWVIDPENQEEMIKCLSDVIKIKKEELKVIGKMGYDYALANYSKDINLNKTLDCIVELVNKYEIQKN